MNPQFPHFKTVELEDRQIVSPILWNYQPQTSEWTFTNFFIWRHYYRFQWALYGDWLMFLCHPKDEPEPYSLMPIGPGPRIEAANAVLEWLKKEKGQTAPTIRKADARFIAELQSEGGFLVEPQREHFDYVYAGSDLISLAGRKFHSKKNHLNRFERKHPSHRYLPLDETLAPECLDVLEKWKGSKDFTNNPVLHAESDAVKEALAHFSGLGLKGGVIEIDGRIEAFTIGGLLNRDTAVVHIEKADPDIPGLYATINQRFVREQWPSIPWINREQDLDEPGLRRAKSSYNPVMMIEKYKVQQAGSSHP